jgi:hypothetical protein
LDEYFGKWGQTINPMLGYKNDLEEKIKQLKVRQEMEEARINQIKKENDYYTEGAMKACKLIISVLHNRETSIV